MIPKAKKFRNSWKPVSGREHSPDVSGTMIHRYTHVVASLVTLWVAPIAGAQGSLTPAGAPAPTQKSLQEIWDKLGALESMSAVQQQQNQSLQTELTNLREQNSGLHHELDAINRTLDRQGKVLSTIYRPQTWRISVVDASPSGGDPSGAETSLAFGPDGRPAISYYDAGNEDLRIARFNGSSWSITTVESIEDRGRHSTLVFDPNGQPAIAYSSGFRNSIFDLRLARFTGSVWLSTIVSSNVFVGGRISLVFGGDHLPVIGFSDVGVYNPQGLLARLVVNPPDEIWVQSSFLAGREVSLTVEPGGQVAGCVYLNLAPWAGLSYFGSVSDRNEQVAHLGEFYSVGFDTTGAPNVVYWDSVDGAFRIAKRFPDGLWTSRLLTSFSTAPYSVSSFRFGPDGTVALAFADSSALWFFQDVGIQPRSVMIYGDSSFPLFQRVHGVSLAFGPVDSQRFRF